MLELVRDEVAPGFVAEAAVTVRTRRKDGSVVSSFLLARHEGTDERADAEWTGDDGVLELHVRPGTWTAVERRWDGEEPVEFVLPPNR